MSQEYYKNILEQQHAILEASAGTGKTYSIVEMVKILLEDNIKISDILLLTFTNKATLELKIRVKKAFYEAYEQALPQDKHKYLRWIKQIDMLSIYTIHSFLHQSIALLDTGKQLDITQKEDQKEEIKYIQKAREVFLELLIGKPYLIWDDLSLDTINFLIDLSDPDKKDWDQVFNVSKIQKFERTQTKQLLKTIHNFEYIHCLDQTTIQTQFIPHLLNKDRIEEYIDNIISKIHHHILEPILEFKSTLTGSNKHFRVLCKTIEQILAIQDNKQKIILFSHLKSLDFKTLFIKRYEGIYSYLKILQDILVDIETLSYQILIYLAYCVAQDITQNNPLIYGFKGKIHLANQLAYNAAQKQYYPFFFSHIFIDEFQDTNILEWETLKLLFLKPQNISSKIFIIGDPKQAIYQFKGSDINAYQKAKQDIVSLGGQIFVLDKNYRTQENLLTSFNHLFSSPHYYGNNDNAETISYQNLTIGKIEQKENNNAYFIALGVEGEAKENKKTNKIAFDTKDLKSIASIYVSSIQKDLKQTNHQNLKIAVLSDKNDYLKMMKPILEQQNIPYLYYGERELFQSDIAYYIQILFYALKKNATYLDTLLALQTPFFPQDELQSYPIINLYRSLAHKHKWALLRLELINSPYPQHNLSQKEYETFTQIIDKIVAYIYEKEQSLEEIIEYMEDLALDIQKDHPDNIYQDHQSSLLNRVELLTIHASKGLEFDIVYLLLSFKDKNLKTPFIFKEIEDSAYHSRIYFFGDEQIKDKAYQLQEEERKNLFYVALTRAKQQLVLAYPKDNESFLVKSLTPLLDQTDIINICGDLETIKQSMHINPQDLDLNMDILGSPTNLSLSMPSFRGRTWQMVSYTSLSKHVHSNYFIELPATSSSHNDSLESILLPPGKHTGIFLHTLLENIRWIWSESTSLSVYISDMMKKYSFRDIPLDIFLKIEQYGLDFVARTQEGKTLLKDSTLRYFLHYYMGQKSDQNLYKPFHSSIGLFHSELQKLLDRILNLTLVGQNKTIQEIIFSQSKQEMTMSFQTLKNDYHYIESTLDMVFIGSDHKIYFLDWKTDILDSYDSHFLGAYIAKNYSLQWKLYLIALESFLQTFLDSFNYDLSIGGFYYVFVRGIYHPENQGVYFQKAPLQKELQEMKIELQGIITHHE